MNFDRGVARHQKSLFVKCNREFIRGPLNKNQFPFLETFSLAPWL
ncbi:MAG: hypothetical protein QOH70_2432 [Blastocatellia bacterium]|nr:hypothetical protein [Blastocatellia bacterium]